MIKSDAEYDVIKEQHTSARTAISRQVERLKEMGFSDDDIASITMPTISMIEDQENELRLYEGLKSGDIRALRGLSPNLQLIGLRIAKGISQAELARRLGVTPAQVSKDEKNDYHGVSLQKFEKVIDALEVGEVYSFVLDNKQLERVHEELTRVSEGIGNTVVVARPSRTRRELAAAASG
ncbi:MAG: helix-turn-helix transcriptional regulator [Firmicutes bacterium]|nr:helix-turn-helix transcriptional regulator [Bacillota bacterium]